jgi:hypothetical protein
MLRRASSEDRGLFSYEPARGDLVARRSVGFVCPSGHEFMVVFADGVTLPSSWECRQHGVQAGLRGVPHHQQQPPVVVRSHWDLLRERRRDAELARLLAEQLRELRAGRLVPVSTWLRRSRQVEVM